ncbi:hypothetical protein GCK72_005300 [Caenorhabditis remanei]|uniref:FACT complex subunit n=1 Tax=Caenorhabditis remanei TaxID=31234 RepID=A0A6A5HC18_CAERE|nr:hypothetical protein GCK72_005300 [Caenorhabditis remanei]KAF1765348.1 hypothetical protein GCK72_005300 [Caenorhabditis remanei]
MVLDRNQFFERAGLVYENWEDGKYGLNNIKSLLIVNGGSINPYSKTAAFQYWLFGQELIGSIVLFLKDQIFILVKDRKVSFFKSIVSNEFNGKVPPVNIISRNKSDNDAGNFQKLVDLIRAAGGKIGTVMKEKTQSDFWNSWNRVIEQDGMEKTDISMGLTNLLSVKDEKEIELIRKSSEVTCKVWSLAKQRFVKIIDETNRVRHSELSKEISKYIKHSESEKSISKYEIDSCYDPIVMSGGNNSFKWSHESSKDHLLTQTGTIITSFGARFSNYCTNLTRTMLIFPTSELTNAYESILSTHEAVISALKPGVKLNEVYEIGFDTLKKKNPELAEHLYKKELGFSTGIEFRESQLTISAKCNEVVKAGMAFVVYIGVDNILNTKNGNEEAPAAIAISDTILVKNDGKNEILTGNAKSRLKSNVISMIETKETVQVQKKQLGRGQRNVMINDKTRNKITNEEMRREKQKELYEKLTEDAKARMIGKESGKEKEENVNNENNSLVAYKSENRFPQDSDIQKMLIHVDRKNNSVILPISGIPVPYHISMIKSSMISTEENFTYLRINFVTSGGTIGKKNEKEQLISADFIKELTFREDKNHHNLVNADRQIKEIQKRLKQEKEEKQETEGLVKQEKLILSVNRVNPKLKELHVRPTIIPKKLTGSLEAHTNGFRYTSIRNDRIDILYNNIKHAFFQPCDNEMIILLHFQLKNAVLWGKKAYTDVQFYSEIAEVSMDLGSYKMMQERDEMRREQMDRDMRRRLNSAYSSFCEKISRLTNGNIEFDSPFSELGFLGVPHLSTVTLKPTTSCLVNLTEWPHFIVTLSEVELVHFERVGLQLKNFDMVFIFKDYSIKPKKVTDIPISSLEKIKEWLHTCDIWYSEGKEPLKWAYIMKTALEDPVGFFEIGGWSTIGTDSSGCDIMDSDDSDAYETEDEGRNPDESSSDSESEGDDEEEEVEEEEEGEEEGETDGEESMDSDEDSDMEEDDEEMVDRKRPSSSDTGPSSKRRK